jgi:hypothetical protein
MHPATFDWLFAYRLLAFIGELPSAIAGGPDKSIFPQEPERLTG